jgi:hypothetical protein
MPAWFHVKALQRSSAIEVTGFITALFIGLIIGALGRLVAPGKQNIPDLAHHAGRHRRSCRRNDACVRLDDELNPVDAASDGHSHGDAAGRDAGSRLNPEQRGVQCPVANGSGLLRRQKVGCLTVEITSLPACP